MTDMRSDVTMLLDSSIRTRAYLGLVACCLALGACLDAHRGTEAHDDLDVPDVDGTPDAPDEPGAA